MPDTPNPVDYLKYLASEVGHLIEGATDQLAGTVYEELTLAQRESILDSALGQLDAARHALYESVSVFCRDRNDMETYANGRSVRTTTEIEMGSYFSYDWHPQVGHHDDRPRTLCDVETRDGATKEVVIMRDGVIEIRDTHQRVSMAADTLRLILVKGGGE